MNDCDILNFVNKEYIYSNNEIVQNIDFSILEKEIISVKENYHKLMKKKKNEKDCIIKINNRNDKFYLQNVVKINDQIMANKKMKKLKYSSKRIDNLSKFHKFTKIYKKKIDKYKKRKNIYVFLINKNNVNNKYTIFLGSCPLIDKNHSKTYSYENDNISTEIRNKYIITPGLFTNSILPFCETDNENNMIQMIINEIYTYINLIRKNVFYYEFYNNKNRNKDFLYPDDYCKVKVLFVNLLNIYNKLNERINNAYNIKNSNLNLFDILYQKENSLNYMNIFEENQILNNIRKIIKKLQYPESMSKLEIEEHANNIFSDSLNRLIKMETKKKNNILCLQLINILIEIKKNMNNQYFLQSINVFEGLENERNSISSRYNINTESNEKNNEKNDELVGDNEYNNCHNNISNNNEKNINNNEKNINNNENNINNNENNINNNENNINNNDNNINNNETNNINNNNYNNEINELDITEFKNMKLENIKKILTSNDPDIIKILICTDNHLGYKECNAIRNYDSFNTFEEILFISDKLNVDFILNSGDLFDKTRITDKSLQKTMFLLNKYCINRNNDLEHNLTKSNNNDNLKESVKVVNNDELTYYNAKENNIVQTDSELSDFKKSTNSSSDEDLININKNMKFKRKKKNQKKNKSKKKKNDDLFSKSSDGCNLDIDVTDNYINDNDNFMYSNYDSLNENFKKKIPFFVINGNHDYPNGYNNISLLDILKFSNLINFVGKMDLCKFEIKPILLEKGKTKIAIYPIGWIKDERLYRAFEKNKVKFLISNDYEERINILLLHQNRYIRNSYGKNTKNYIKENFIPNFIDIVIWGHEHFSKPFLEKSSFGNFFNLQLGSSICTSLSVHDYGEKYIGLLEINNGKFRFIKINLETVRPFKMKNISLCNYNLNFHDESILKDFLDKEIHIMLEKIQEDFMKSLKRYYLFKKLMKKNDNIVDNCNDSLDKEELNEKEKEMYIDFLTTKKDINDFYDNLNNEDFYSSSFIHFALSDEKDTFNLIKIKKSVYSIPIIKLKVEYDNIEIFNIPSFSSLYITKIANASNFLSFYKKQKKKINFNGTDESNFPKLTNESDCEGKDNINDNINTFNNVFNSCYSNSQFTFLDKKSIKDTMENYFKYYVDDSGKILYDSSFIKKEVDNSLKDNIEKIEHQIRDVCPDNLNDEYFENLIKK